MNAVGSLIMIVRLKGGWNSPPPSSLGVRLATSPEAFGELRDSTDRRDDYPELKRRLAEDGYLMLRGLLDRESVDAAREQVVESLAHRGMLDRSFPTSDRVAKPGARISKFGFAEEDCRFAAVRQMVRHGRAMLFFEDLLAEPARVFDYIWMRMMAPGQASAPHCDIVYMGRGTRELYTTWIPLTPVSMADGPLMVLEGSHRVERLRNEYGAMDIDKNGNWRRLRLRHGWVFRGGDYSRNPRRTREEFGLRWLTAQFEPGDVVIFTPYTLHGSLDNHSRQFRISIDARYQRASDPIDERWIGDEPIAHSQGK
jgi:ectoine hydroxylase-related dioxygenase (phytanoyl-CoA dioxygenase family)